MIEAIKENGAKGKKEAAERGHLVALPDGFALWRWACLRGAGFPAAMASQLASPACALAADQLFLLEKEIDEKHAEAMAALRQHMEGCEDKGKRKILLDALTQLKKRKLTGPLEVHEVEEARKKFWAVYCSRAAVETRYREEFKASLAEISEKIRGIASDPGFQQAMLLQNRVALRRIVASLVDAGPTRRTTKEKQKEELVAKYLQRYCMKNDTIGFFGPVGWLRFNPECESIRAHPGTGLVDRSTFYFEQWCIEALAEKIAEDGSLQEWMAPRRLPTFYLEGSKLYFPGGASTMLRPVQAAILNRCTGEATAREIATGVMSRQGSGQGSRNDVYTILRDFVRRGIITWKLELPWFHPERSLRCLLERIGVEEKRRSALAMLEELEQARERASAAFGNAERLDAELERLEEIFSRLTGKSTTRHEGQMYAGRTLIYQECRRDMELELGREIMGGLSGPLLLLLTAARWVTHEAAALVREQCRKIYGEALREGRDYVELIPLWLQMQGLLEANGPLFRRVSEALQARWQRILCVPREQRRVSYSSQELKQAVEEAFAAPGYGWQAGRHHSPDIMIAAPSVEAIQKGDYLLVLGELHVAVNTLRAHFVMSQHPFPEEMSEAMEGDMFIDQIMPADSHSWLGANARTSFSLVSRRHYYMETSHDSLSIGPRSRTVPISAFIVRDTPEGLLVQTRDGRLKFDIVEFFGEMLSIRVPDHLRIMATGPHIPRVTIDRVVVQREQWSYRAAEMQFAQKEEECDRFLEARRWMHEHGMPRYVFVNAHIEDKPFYVDLESPVYVEILLKLVRRVLASDQPDTPIMITEMLPSPEQLWLPDKDNRKYSSEIRMAVVDHNGNGSLGWWQAPNMSAEAPTTHFFKSV